MGHWYRDESFHPALLLSERVAQKVRRKEKRVRLSREVGDRGRVINNENMVSVKEKSRGRGKQKYWSRRIRAIKNRKQQNGWQETSCYFVFDTAEESWRDYSQS